MPRDSKHFVAIGSLPDSYWNSVAAFWKAEGARAPPLFKASGSYPALGIAHRTAVSPRGSEPGTVTDQPPRPVGLSTGCAHEICVQWSKYPLHVLRGTVTDQTSAGVILPEGGVHCSKCRAHTAVVPMGRVPPHPIQKRRRAQGG